MRSAPPHTLLQPASAILLVAEFSRATDARVSSYPRVSLNCESSPARTNFNEFEIYLAVTQTLASALSDLEKSPPTS